MKSGILIRIATGNAPSLILFASWAIPVFCFAKSDDYTFKDGEPAVQKVKNAVVSIYMKGGRTVKAVGGWKLSSPGTGSGSFIDAEGYIATADHVVRNAAKVYITTIDGREAEAEIVGEDPFIDVALLRLVDRTKVTSNFLRFDESGTLESGMKVVAVGSPKGLAHSFSSGIVSALNRSIQSPLHLIENYIQTDAPINPGNSGGPLLNLNAEVVGINDAKYLKADGVAYAIPAFMVRRSLAALRKGRPPEYAYLGLVLKELSRYSRDQYEVGNEPSEGLLVIAAVKGGPAFFSGLDFRDVITQVDGKPVRRYADLFAALFAKNAGEAIRLEWVRKGVKMEKSVTTASFPEVSPIGFINFFRSNFDIELAPMKTAKGGRGFVVQKVYNPVADGRPASFFKKDDQISRIKPLSPSGVLEELADEEEADFLIECSYLNQRDVAFTFEYLPGGWANMARTLQFNFPDQSHTF
ncbi:MAG: trypsin-like peptidase domain-containing protein [Spirochaetia bacterium]|nr:trypsin-like peptidase domain-containing protein [Spirochaetia bacterium]